jgi:transposase
MKLEAIDIDKALEDTKRLLKEDEGISPALKSSIGVLLLLVKILVDRLGVNSQNSSKPPSSDPNREKKKRKPGDKKPGGQKGQKGTTLQKEPNPDHIEPIKIERSSLPPAIYKDDGFESRQVIEIDISRIVTEYRAQVLVDQNGNRFVAEFPEGVTRPIQYGASVKANSVYMSLHQLIPYNRVTEHFSDQMSIPVSAGSVFNFNLEAYKKLELFETIIKSKLVNSSFIHVDETGININGKGQWLHSASNNSWTLFFPHLRRGKEAIDEMGVLPDFAGIACHDHWKAYYTYDCLHALCNAHHLRELERAWEQDGQKWAKKMKALLLEINQKVDDAGDMLNAKEAMKYRKKYRRVLKAGQIECPPPDDNRKKGTRGRLKRSKARNLLERFVNFEEDILRFMENPIVPFSNNQAENDIRMTKVQQKISGCFRSMEGAQIFCRVRSYLSTCRKNDVNSSEALRLLFSGKLPDFLLQAED